MPWYLTAASAVKWGGAIMRWDVQLAGALFHQEFGYVMLPQVARVMKRIPSIFITLMRVFAYGQRAVAQLYRTQVTHTMDEREMDKLYACSPSAASCMTPSRSAILMHRL